jgi:uncharacterized iron-regulated membrane protein
MLDQTNRAVATAEISLLGGDLYDALARTRHAICKEQTRYYLDPNTGALVQRADATGQWRRWLFSGLHRLDFTPLMRARPFWDIMMWLTMLGGLAVSVTGVYLGIRRIRSDVAVVFRRRTSNTGASESRMPS